MRHYVKGTKSYQKNHCQDREHSPSLPPFPKDPISQSKQGLNEWIERDPTTWSSPSRCCHVEALKSAKVQLNYAYLVDSERQLMHTRLTEEQNRRNNSRKSLHKGGAISVLEARKKKSDWQGKEKTDVIRKVKTAIQQQTSKATKDLKARGVLAHKEEKIRKKKYVDLLSRGEVLPVGIDIPIWDPEKNLTQAEQEAFLPHIFLVERLNKLCPKSSPVVPLILDLELEKMEQEVEIITITEAEREPAWVVKDWESSNKSVKSAEIQSMMDSSDAASCCSVDSIARNADFVKFG